MKIACIGGGPGGLEFAILMKTRWPDAEVVVHERNKADDTFGWGVVFSDETLDNVRVADPQTVAAIERNFVRWEDIDTTVRGDKTVSTGHGFCGVSRKVLLQELHARCHELKVELKFESVIGSIDELSDCDLIVAADGVNSEVREQHAAAFKPTVEMGKCRFAWFGTDLDLEAFTFLFVESPDGLFMVHAYPFQKGDENRGTWIVECHEETWRAAGLDTATEEESIAYCQKLFKKWLGKKHSLLGNRSVWRQFPTVVNEKWHTKNLVLLGDAAHTAHFSIGSGTKLAMEDAIALANAFGDPKERKKPLPVDEALPAYQEARYVDVLKTQKAAQTSLEWFENAQRYLKQKPLRFTFNLLTRSKRITYDNLALRDPELVEAVARDFAKRAGAKIRKNDAVLPPAFTPLSLRELELDNRIVVSPMCQYSASDGRINDWHLVHYGSRAIGGAGLVITEMTDVSESGRITRGCAGLWGDDHVVAWRRVVDFVRENSNAAIGVQLAHAGRKGSSFHPWEGPDVPLTGEDAWETMAPSALAWDEGWPVPKEMARLEMDKVLDQFVHSVKLAEECGFDLVELHMAHGYLLSSFLSPMSNQRDDEYGGSLENRARYPLEVFAACRDVWPNSKPMAVRISATDWLGDEGFTAAEAVEFSTMLQAAGCDLIDVSTAGNTPRSKPIYGRMYQAPYAELIRHEVGIPTMAVGAILGADHANTLLGAGRCDLTALGRPHLREPYLALGAATRYGIEVEWPGQYLLGKPRETP